MAEFSDSTQPPAIWNTTDPALAKQAEEAKARYEQVMLQKWQKELNEQAAVAKQAAEKYAEILKESGKRVSLDFEVLNDLQNSLLRTNWVPEPDIPTREEEWAASAWIDNGDWP